MCADILKDLAQGRQPPPDDVVTSLNAVYANAEREGGAGLPTERVAEVVKSILEALKRRKTTREYEYLQYCAQLVRSLPRARTQTHPGILIGLCKTVTGTVNRVQCKITTRNQWLELLCAYIDAMESMARQGIQPAADLCEYLGTQVPETIGDNPFQIPKELAAQLLRLCALAPSPGLLGFAVHAAYRHQLIREEPDLSQHLSLLRPLRDTEHPVHMAGGGSDSRSLDHGYKRRAKEVPHGGHLNRTA